MCDFCSHGASDLSGIGSRMPQTNLAVSGTSIIQGVDALARSQDCTTQRARLIERMRMRLTAYRVISTPRSNRVALVRSKADINFGASSYRVYEYTAWLSWPARIIPHTWEIRTRCSMGSRNFSRGFVRCRAGSNFGNNSLHRCRRFYEAGSIGKWGELLHARWASTPCRDPLPVIH